MANPITDELLDRLEFVESSNRPKIVHPQSGAMGAYQFLPETVDYVSKKYGAFDPFNRDQARERARQYLTELYNKHGDLDKALKVYGGFVTKDSSNYLAKVKGMANNSTDPFDLAIDNSMAKTSPVNKKESKVSSDPFDVAIDTNIARDERRAKITPSQINQAEQEMRSPSAPNTSVTGEIDLSGQESEQSLGDAMKGILKGFNKKNLVETKEGAIRAIKATPNVAESTIRGAVSGTVGAAGDVNKFIVNNIGSIEALPALPTSEQIRGAIPRVTQAHEGTSNVEETFSAIGLPPGLLAKVTGLNQLRNLIYPEIKTGAKFFSSPQAEGKTFTGFRQEQKALGRSVGAAETSHATRVANAINEARPEVQAVLRNVNPKNINIQGLERDNLAFKHGWRLTEGEKTQNTAQLADEFNKMKLQGAEALKANAENRTNQFINSLDNVIDTQAPQITVTNKLDLGQTAIDNIIPRWQAILKDESAKWKAVFDQAGGKIKINGKEFTKNLNKKLNDKFLLEHLPSSFRTQLDKIAKQGYLDSQGFEALRTNLATAMRVGTDGNAKQAAHVVRDFLENNLPLKGKSLESKKLADVARKATRDKYRLLNEIPALKAIAKDGRTVDEISEGIEHASADKFIDKFILKGNSAEIKRLINFIGKDSVAHQAMKVAIVEDLKRVAGIVDNAGNASQKSFNNRLNNVLKYRADTVLGKQASKDLSEIGELLRLTEHVRPTGHANVSNTATTILRAGAEGVANAKTGGGYGFLKSMIEPTRNRRFASKALAPKSGIIQKNYLRDIGNK